MKQYAYFKELPVNATFSLNGNQYLKKSTRTAGIVCPEEYANTWFYFAEKDLVTVGRHSRLSADYFKH